MLRREIQYTDGETDFRGVLISNENSIGKRPAVLVAHDWSGRNEFAERKAEKMAELGYVGFAIDMFGGKTGQTKEEKSALIAPLLDDRELLKRRIVAAFEILKKQEEVDQHAIGAIGFCFGGLCVLDLARSGTNVAGIVSFHGLLFPPPQADAKIKAKILALHGHDDPMVPPEQVLAFENEMTKAQADWQVHIYGNTKHAFTNPLANDPDFGTVYQAISDARSWRAMRDFFQEVFGR